MHSSPLIPQYETFNDNQLMNQSNLSEQLWWNSIHPFHTYTPCDMYTFLYQLYLKANRKTTRFFYSFRCSRFSSINPANTDDRIMVVVGLLILYQIKLLPIIKPRMPFIPYFHRDLIPINAHYFRWQAVTARSDKAAIHFQSSHHVIEITLWAWALEIQQKINSPWSQFHS